MPIDKVVENFMEFLEHRQSVTDGRQPLPLLARCLQGGGLFVAEEPYAAAAVEPPPKREITMADDPNEDAKPTETQREAQEALEKQVAQLKREINKINRTLVEEATGWYEGAADSVSRTTQALRKRASTASGVAQENPGTLSSAFMLGAAVGLLLGLVLVAGDPRRERWF
ncbi:hypothetical protein [Mesorhizobium muleiense]|uniref:Membrane-anchored ribosome-binding protein, inhibits growth in stationary phase, ElaB/YqjD/DUF883 family n=1 Tax=Mesorhizobium muleiense TaxID=1004279 RepID=A0A1G8MSR5_9HYPH|nr:hypothetical protein [Mesorhizobium muleiense]MCF6103105.1 hypothetical protein [Mesorhizobium muleiense]SDI71088.1 hypothetical protein SAMN05428953_102666 [Mesorhizobium muleiense]